MLDRRGSAGAGWTRSVPDVELELEGRRHRVEVVRGGSEWRVALDGREVRVDARHVDGRWSLLLGPGAPEPNPGHGAVRASHELTIDVRSSGEVLVHVDGRPVVLSVAGAVRRAGEGPAATAGVGGGQQILAPMPGRIVKVLVKPGDAVQARQPLVVIEAMKMENELRAAAAGTVSEVRVTEGALVESRTVLVVLRETAAMAGEELNEQ